MGNFMDGQLYIWLLRWQVGTIVYHARGPNFAGEWYHPSYVLLLEVNALASAVSIISIHRGLPTEHFRRG